MKLTITWVGQPKDITTKFGVKQKFSIKAQEHGENYLDVWSSPTTKDWKVGQTVEVESVAEREYNGKTYYEVKMPKAGATSQADINSIKTSLVNLGVHMTTIETLVRKIGRMMEEKNGVIATAKGDVKKEDLADLADLEFNAIAYPENDLGDIDFDPKD